MTTQTTTTTRTPASMQRHDRRDLRVVVGMTAATLALLGSIALWQVHAGGEAAPATTGTTRASNQSIAVGGPALLVPVSDAVMYQQWLDRAATALLPVEPSAVSDQEMFRQWQQRPMLAADDAGPVLYLVSSVPPTRRRAPASLRSRW